MFPHSDTPDTDAEQDLDADPFAALDDAPEPISLPVFASADDAQLQLWLARIVRQDETALNDLYRACIGRAYGLALRIVRNPALAEEVVEDSFWQIWRQAPRFDTQRAPAMAWILMIVRSRALDTLRTNHRMTSHNVSVEQIDPARQPQDNATKVASPPDLLQALQTSEQLHRALAQLDATPRQLLALAFFQDLSHGEIASHTGLPLGTVKTHIRRSIITLRKTMSPACPDLSYDPSPNLP
jgi:RNA polymerase sigma factor (sigma-70 family)